MDIKEIIRKFIEEEVFQDKIVNLDNDTELIRSNLMDSLSIVKLLVSLEETFNISLDDELELVNFSSINNIAAVVERKK